MILCNRNSERLRTAFTYVLLLGGLLAATIPVVRARLLRGPESLAPLAVLLLAFLHQGKEGDDTKKSMLTKYGAVAAFTCVIAAFAAALSSSGLLLPWRDDVLALLWPAYAHSRMPLVVSLAENQPLSSSRALADLHALLFLSLVGASLAIRRRSDSDVFLLGFFAGSLLATIRVVRFMPLLAIAACLLSALGLVQLLEAHLPAAQAYVVSGRATSDSDKTTESERADGKGRKQKRGSGNSTTGSSSPMMQRLSTLLTGGVVVACGSFVAHGVRTAQADYVVPSIVLAAQQPDGSRFLIDDFRKAYAWMRNTTRECRSVP